jgi:hypothetical protein
VKVVSFETTAELLENLWVNCAGNHRKRSPEGEIDPGIAEVRFPLGGLFGVMKTISEAPKP